MFVRMGQYLDEMILFTYLESEGANIAFKVVQIKFLVMHIPNQNFGFDIGNIQNMIFT